MSFTVSGGFTESYCLALHGDRFNFLELNFSSYILLQE